METMTLRDIIRQYEHSNRSGVDRSLRAAIAAAYWAGKEEMRGMIVAGLEQRRRSLPFGRYHNEQRRAVSHLLQDGLLGGQGRNDAAEILAWDFEVSDVV